VLVVADAGPPHYLVLIGVIDLLPKLFGRVALPELVRDELRHARTPDIVRRWLADPPPAWIEFVATPALGDLSSPKLGAGERAAIALAVSRRADLVLMDDRQGVAAASAVGLRVIGTIGVLDRGAAGIDRFAGSRRTTSRDELPLPPRAARRAVGATRGGEAVNVFIR
jgi:predicted nucleic acid-binding protein